MVKKSLRPLPANAKPYLALVDIADLGPADRVARQILDVRRDLLPSVARIMDADLDPESTLVAMELFRESLESGSDPHRDPRAAIATAAARQAAATPT
jgi:hypothetical protein